MQTSREPLLIIKSFSSSSSRRSMFVHNLENELKGQQVVKKNANEGTAKDPTFLFLSQVFKLNESLLLNYPNIFSIKRRVNWVTRRCYEDFCSKQNKANSNTFESNIIRTPTLLFIWHVTMAMLVSDC